MSHTCTHTRTHTHTHAHTHTHTRTRMHTHDYKHMCFFVAFTAPLEDTDQLDFVQLTSWCAISLQYKMNDFEFPQVYLMAIFLISFATS